MTSSKSASARLNTMLLGLEHIVLQPDAKERGIDSPAVKEMVAEARKLVPVPMSISPARKRLEAKQQSERGGRYVPHDLAAQIRLLKALSRSRPELSPTIRSVFSGKRKPSTDEIAKLTAKLVKLGVLRKKD